MTTYVDTRPPAMIDGRVVEWDELRPRLNEAAGGLILQEVILDRQVAVELLQAGLVIRPDDVDRERKLFYETLDPDPDVAVRLARELRARQGLGETRFASLLRRNASLRALVAGRVDVSEEAVRQTWEILYGARRQARLLVVPTLQDAQQALNRLEAGEYFGDVAVELSTDASAQRGGLLSPISRADPSYPPVVRDELWELEPGEVSPPILLGDQYAVLLMVAELPPQDVELESVRDDLVRRARLAQERILMDQLARRLLATTTVTIFDDALKESWDAQFRERRSGP